MNKLRKYLIHKLGGFIPGEQIKFINVTTRFETLKLEKSEMDCINIPKEYIYKEIGKEIGATLINNGYIHIDIKHNNEQTLTNYVATLKVKRMEDN